MEESQRVAGAELKNWIESVIGHENFFDRNDNNNNNNNNNKGKHIIRSSGLT
jgi:hypothetical protein